MAKRNNKLTAIFKIYEKIQKIARFWENSTRKAEYWMRECSFGTKYFTKKNLKMIVFTFEKKQDFEN